MTTFFALKFKILLFSQIFDYLNLLSKEIRNKKYFFVYKLRNLTLFFKFKALTDLLHLIKFFRLSTNNRKRDFSYGKNN